MNAASVAAEQEGDLRHHGDRRQKRKKESSDHAAGFRTL